ncbi:MAG TPA: hypothetical protein DCX45_03520 [Acinetobacter junii]|nr:hypothetical protein [Acinetobacter junii]
MSVKNFTKDDILRAIYAKYGTLEELAIKLNTSKQNISAKLKRRSPKFLSELRTAGIIVYGDDQQKNIVSETLVTYQANRIMDLEKEVEKLKEENVKLRVGSVSLIKNKGNKIK